MSEPTQTLVRRTAGWPAVLLAGIATFAAGLVVLSNTGGWGVAIAALYTIWTVWILRQKIVLELDDNALTVRLHNRSRRIPYSDIAEVAPAPRVPLTMFMGVALLTGQPWRVDNADAFTLGGPVVRIHTRNSDDCVVAVSDVDQAIALIKARTQPE
ncbi:hypothetical protein [Corynebacterium sp. HMSC29G08]|uniref:hypothetical protein n=1 Tax=Corynebacterium sp. HMSC29G08 TaxID=1581069 RepID=UPI0008A4D6FF|nr:hypothetical protein [Corynebacterium sp. HMSC29G08]OFT84940.1 hypothetical protein HMPREF3101_03805 [Corynebacterium sp. HMSC29G08]